MQPFPCHRRWKSDSKHWIFLPLTRKYWSLPWSCQWRQDSDASVWWWDVVFHAGSSGLVHARNATLTITGLWHPDRTFTIWPRPWQVTTCVTTASSGKRSLCMHMAEPPGVCIVWYKRTKELETWCEHLKSLKKLVLPMYFLKADDVDVFDKSAGVVMCLFPGNLWGSRRSNKTSRIPGNTSKTAIRNMDTCVPVQATSLYLRLLKSISPPT